MVAQNILISSGNQGAFLIQHLFSNNSHQKAIDPEYYSIFPVTKPAIVPVFCFTIGLDKEVDCWPSVVIEQTL